MRNAVALAGALLVACGTSAPTSASPTLTPAAGRSQAPASATAPAARTSTAPAATPTRPPGSAEVTLRWDTGAIIADVDDVSDIVTRLKNTPGIVGGFGDETQITILYDAQRITPERIQRVLADMGFPTRRP